MVHLEDDSFTDGFMGRGRAEFCERERERGERVRARESGREREKRGRKRGEESEREG